MNYRRAFVPNGYLHIIITSYDRKPIFIENIDILRTTFKNTKVVGWGFYPNNKICYKIRT